jgi:hypothetical protein
MKKQILFTLLILLPTQLVYAQDISMSVDQTTYYFLTGEEAVIPIEFENSFDRQISGLLQYTVTQQINQGNFQYSSSNTQSNSFAVNEGTETASLNFGTSNTPLTMTVNLSFLYNENDQFEVPLGPIIIHFVTDESQKNNLSNPMQGSSQKTTTQQQDPFTQQQQQLQQRLDQMLGNQPTLPQDPQQRLQNNQLSQDSSTLKQEIQKQLQDQKQLNEDFQKELANNQEFQELHQDLLQNGYNVTSGNLNPSSKNTGSFEIQYQNENGKWAKLQGTMEEGKITDLQKQSQEQQKSMLDKLSQNDDFKQYQAQLQNEGFSEDEIQFMQDGNKTNVILNYNNTQEQKASISAEFVEGEINKVNLEKDETESDLIWWLIPMIVASTIGAYFLYRIKSKKTITLIEKQIIKEKPFNYVLEAKKLLEKAKEFFEDNQYKDAYGTAAQALRLFLSYQHGVKREITNEEILEIINVKNSVRDKIKNCFDLCSLVEFAKYDPNTEDFNKIIQNITNVIEHQKMNN